MAEEIIYIGPYNNTRNYRLEGPPGSPINLSNVSAIVANINGLKVSSENSANDLIRWNQSGFVSGEIRCELGTAPGLREGKGQIHFIIYDPTNASGIVFSAIPVRIEKLL